MIRLTVLILCTVVGLACTNRAATSVGGDDGASAAMWPDGPPATIDAATPAPACAEIQKQGAKRLSPNAASYALVSSDLERVVLLGEIDGAWHVEIAATATGELRRFGAEGPLGAASIRSAVDHQSHNVCWALDERALLTVIGPPESGKQPPGSYGDLSLIDLETGRISGVAEQICGAVLDRDGLNVYVVHTCNAGAGTLSRVDLATGDRQDLGGEVRADSISISPSGQLAFIDRLMSGPKLIVGNPNDPASFKDVASDVVDRSVYFVSDNLLLWREGCDTGCSETLHARVGTAGTHKIASGYTYGHYAPYYKVTGDGRHVLAAGGWFDAPGPLYSLQLDGSGDVVQLADDVMLQNPIMSMITPFPLLTADGRFVVFQTFRDSDVDPFAAGLAAVRLADGKRVELATYSVGITTVAVSPVGAKILFSEGVNDRGELVMIDLDSSERRPLLDGPGHRGQFLPGGNGVVSTWYKQPLTHVTACLDEPPVCQPIGNWERSPLAGGYAVSPDGCFAVLTTDREEPGTHLVPFAHSTR